MNRQIWIIFLLITNALSGFCQLIDDFGSNDLSQVWVGDRDHFSIEDGSLRLQANEAGSSELFAPIIWSETLTWEIDFWLDFNPSNQNQLRLILFASDTSIAPANAIYLEIGETGSNDALNLVLQQGSEIQLLATGNMGLVAIEPDIELRATLEGGFLTIHVNEETLGRFEEDIVALISDFSPSAQGYFGWDCSYTSTRVDRFYFDNVYVGEPRIDSVKPYVTNFRYINDEFSITWSEEIQDSYNLNVSPSLTSLTSSLNNSEIRISGAFETGIEYSLQFTGVKDIAGNTLDTTLIYTIAKSPQVGDIVINEILFNPEGGGFDYLEIINKTDEVLSIENLVIINTTNGNSEQVIINQIEANSILLFTESITNITTSFPFNNETAMIQQDLPAWNNGSGNVTLLSEDMVIDALDYDEDQHLAIIDDEDGVSLERISVDRPSNDPDNWVSAAGSVGYGTPGLPNSASSGNSTSGLTFELANKVISPNGDNNTDELILNYSLDQSNYIATVSIFSDSGQLMHYLNRNETLAADGQLIWNGRNESGQLLNQGIYIVHISLFNLEGQRYEEQLSFAIAHPNP